MIYPNHNSGPTYPKRYGLLRPFIQPSIEELLHMKKHKEKPIEKTLKSQYDEKFLTGMKARMEMSYFKYGDFRDVYPHKINALQSLQQRIDRYWETGNTEFLIDAANFAMIEFMAPRHAGAHFKSTDSHESPGRTTVHGLVTDRPNKVKHVYKNEGD